MAAAVLLFACGAVPVLAQADVDYLVISPGSFAVEFDSFAQWKTRKGVRTAIVPVETIVAHQPGVDDAAKVRGFIKLWHDSLGVQWVLLAGNPAQVPARQAYAAGQSVLSDMYFADLDGDWDRNGNGIYGEPDDSVEMCPDVCVGRAPVASAGQARGVAAKWMHYELGASHRSLRRLLQYSDSTNLNPPSGWTTALLRPSVGRYQFRDSLQAGFDVTWHVGAGSREMLGDPYAPILDIADAGALTNHDRLGVPLSSASGVADFSADCVLGALVRNPGGGCVAVLGNSGTGYTACRLLYYEFFAGLFGSDSLRRVGQSQRAAKRRYAPDARTDPTWRLALFHWNLLGDPELTVLHDTARSLTVGHPAVLDTGAQAFPVTVSSGAGPCSAYVCLWKGDEVYEREGIVDSGNVAIHPRTHGEMLVTVTAPDCRPYLGAAGVATALAEERPLTAVPAARATVVRATLRWRLLESAAAPADLLDACGRRAMILRAGVNDVSRLAPGVYFAVSKESRGRGTGPGAQKVVVTRWGD
jgi:hypothetical protein